MVTFIHIQTPYHAYRNRRLCDKLDNTASLLDLLLSLGADVAGADDDWDSGQTTLSEDLGVAVVEKVDDGSIAALVGEVLIALLSGDEGPKLVEVDDGLPETVLHLVDCVLELEVHDMIWTGETYSIAYQPFRSNQDGTCQCWSCGGADHRPYHDHRDASSMRLSMYVRCVSRRVSTNVLSDTSVTGGNVAAVLAGLCQSAQSLLALRLGNIIATVYAPGRHVDGAVVLVSWFNSVSPNRGCLGARKAKRASAGR